MTPNEQHAGHPVASCKRCRAAWEHSELCASVDLDAGTCDREGEGTLCPTCGTDLAREIELHLEECKGESL